MDDHPAIATAHHLTSVFTHHCTPHRVVLVSAPDDLAGFLALHDAVVASLDEDQKHFVKKRTLADLFDHVANGHHALAVYAADGQMIGQALLTLPDLDGARNLNGYPFGPALPDDTCAVIQTLGVHPDHKKCGVPEKLFKAARALAAREGRSHLVAKMSAENTRSFTAFAAAGFAQHGNCTQVAGEKYTSVFMTQKLTTDAKTRIPAFIAMTNKTGVHP